MNPGFERRVLIVGDISLPPWTANEPFWLR